MTQFEEAVDRLRARILSGDLQPGDKLGAEELAVDLGMSRTPVREAFVALASEGLVELTLNRGARVVALSRTELEGVFEVRIRLEGLAARRAAERITPEQADHLEKLGLQIAGLHGIHDLEEIQALNTEFHSTLLAVADSSALTLAMSGVVHTTVLNRIRQSFDEDAERRSAAHHLEIVAALRAGDGGWAESVMASHLMSARDSLLGARRDISIPIPESELETE